MEDQRIDIVYKLGSGSNFNNSELRYSLRSLQNFLPLRKVYVVGFKPDWLKVESVTYIPATDPALSNKDYNLINKLILATTDPNLSEEFINISDDQVFLQQCNQEDIEQPYYDNKHIVPETAHSRPNRWQIRLNRTIAVLKERNLPTNCFETHMPVLLNKKDYARTLFQYDYGVDRGYCGNTLYYNTLQIKGRELDPNILVRIIEPVSSVEIVEQICSGKKFLNYTEKSINQNLFLYLQRQFPDKCIYEK